MGCPSEVEIGKNLTFSVTTHDPSTGELTDADAVPSYRVYEDETATAILNGTMAKLDDASTLGFYSEQIACSSANGFENGKTYTIYITAAVNASTGGCCFGFIAYDQRLADAILVEGAAPETKESIAAEVVTEIDATPPGVNVKKINDVTITGVGTVGNPWGPA